MMKRLAYRIQELKYGGLPGETRNETDHFLHAMGNGCKKTILPPSANERAPDVDSHDPVVIAVTRAHRWLALLESGRVASLAELARSLALDGSYVHRMLSLTMLSPEIITSIIDEKGAGYSLAKLTKGFPIMWEEQKAIFLHKP